MMPSQLNKPTYYFSLFILIFSIFAFKVNIIAYGGSGIRIDDLLIFLLLILVVGNIHKDSVPINNKAILLLLLFVLFGMVSVCINNYFHGLPFVSGIIYAARNIEYLLFFYLGYYLAATRFKFTLLVKIYIIYAITLIMLQSFHIIPVFSNFSTNRAIANTGGPWELAAVIAFMLFYSWEYIPNRLYFITTFIILLLTQSRITTFAVILILLVNYMKKLTFKRLTAIAIFVCLFAGIALFANLEILNRYTNLLSGTLFSSLREMLLSYDFTINREAYFNATYGGSALTDVLSRDAEGSALIRFYRWVILLGMTISTKLTIFFGLGPSFASAAVDGNYVRLFIETGVIGTSIFVYMVYVIYRGTKYHFVMKSYMLTVIITAVFIDIYTTYKAMVLLWFYYGYLMRKNHHENTFYPAS